MGFGFLDNAIMIIAVSMVTCNSKVSSRDQTLIFGYLSGRIYRNQNWCGIWNIHHGWYEALISLLITL
jgi:hypothetical protein